MRAPLLALITAASCCAALADGGAFAVRVPHGGIKASAAVDAAGTLHLVYFKGEPAAGDAFYVTSRDGGLTFGEPLQVNSQPDSVLGASSARGPHLALGRAGRVHVLWPGSRTAQPRGPLNPAMPADSPFNGTPLLYARLDGNAFTAQRNLMQKTTALDGDSAIAADAQGGVCVAWHAVTPDGSARDESSRAVWLARSDDDGATFAEERNILPEPTGVCACCALAMNAEGDRVAILYRVAKDKTHRGMCLLSSSDRGASFTAKQLDDWQIAMCPMSTAALRPTRDGFRAAWENAGRIKLAAFPSGTTIEPGGEKNCKHPTVAVNARGETLVAWSEGTGFGSGGTVAWATVNGADWNDPRGLYLATSGRMARALPAHGNIAAVALPDGRFVVIY